MDKHPSFPAFMSAYATVYGIDVGHSGWDKMKFQSGFNFHFSDAKDFEAHCFPAVCVSSFENFLFTSILQFFLIYI